MIYGVISGLKKPVLRIRNVDPGSEFFQPTSTFKKAPVPDPQRRIKIFLTPALGDMIWIFIADSGTQIQGPDFIPFRIPGFKKHRKCKPLGTLAYRTYRKKKAKKSVSVPYHTHELWVLPRKNDENSVNNRLAVFERIYIGSVLISP